MEEGRGQTGPWCGCCRGGRRVPLKEMCRKPLKPPKGRRTHRGGFVTWDSTEQQTQYVERTGAAEQRIQQDGLSLKILFGTARRVGSSPPVRHSFSASWLRLTEGLSPPYLVSPRPTSRVGQSLGFLALLSHSLLLPRLFCCNGILCNSVRPGGWVGGRPTTSPGYLVSGGINQGQSLPLARPSSQANTQLALRPDESNISRPTVWLSHPSGDTDYLDSKPPLAVGLGTQLHPALMSSASISHFQWLCLPLLCSHVTGASPGCSTQTDRK